MAAYLPSLRMTARSRMIPVFAQLRPAIMPSQLAARAVRPFSVSSLALAKDVFVAGLHYDTTEARLGEYLAHYGDVTAVKIVIDKDTRRSKGFGFVTFAKDADADRAVTDANSTELDGRTIKVASKNNTPRSDSRPARAELPIEKDLYIGGLDYATTEDQLRQKLTQFGELESVRVVTDPITHQSRGYGFVKFKTVEAAKKAAAALHESVEGDRKLRVQAGRPVAAKAPSNSLFVRALKTSTTDKQIESAFGKFGKVAEVRLVLDKLNHTARGMAVVSFEEQADAEKAKAAMDGADVDGSKVSVDYNAPRERSPRRPRSDRGDRDYQERGNGFGGRGPRRDRGDGDFRREREDRPRRRQQQFEDE